MTPKEVLIAAKALIDTEDKWFGNTAVAEPGQRCAILAISRAGNNEIARRLAQEALVKVLPRSFRERYSRYTAIILFNDSHTHSTVMKAFNRAIEAAP